ncbi:hypothetical protein CsSME_00052564 [Camellia sinensis var. sinensis]
MKGLLLNMEKRNVANRREHLILLLANIHIRKIPKQTNVLQLGDEVIHELMQKSFKPIALGVPP